MRDLGRVEPALEPGAVSWYERESVRCASLSSVGSAGSLVEDLLDAMPGAAVVTNEGRVLHVNAEFSRLFDYPALETIGLELEDLVMPDGRLHEAEMIAHQLAGSSRVSFETERRTRTGRIFAVSIMVASLRLGGEARGQLVLYQDIQQKKHEEATLRHSALHDELTGLANRGLFLSRAELMLGRLRRRPGRGFAVVYLDLDGFKGVNDRLGHAAGDAVLLEVAARLERCVRPQDTLARLGGDEFALLLDEAGAESEVARVADRLLEEVSRPILIGEEVACVTVSLGVTFACAAYLSGSAEVMLHDADRAMYEAKRAGKGSYRMGPGPTRKVA